MSKFAELDNGLKLCYEINGDEDADPLILVMGWTFPKERWIAQVGPLSEHFKVITFDNRGSGESDRPEGPYTMEMMAGDIIGLMDYLNIEKAHMMGYALGGMILQRLAIDYPDRVDKLVLLNCVAAFPSDEGVENVKNINIKALDFQQNAPRKYFMKSMGMAFHRNFIKQINEDPDQKFHDLWTIDEVAEIFTKNPQEPKDVANQGDAMIGFNILDEISSIKSDTLIISASHNRLHPKAAMEQMHERIPNSTFEVIKKSGDSCYLSRAPEINQLVIDFLK
ncbi:MAG: alpha/beta hydrolase [Promethearchaeota archaeon]|nr:MAG: alpha/beta hydrolase [Candidatus Lokiarchaeota archaeon]